MEYFKLSNDVTIPAIGMGTGWMNTAYKNPKFFTKRVLKELVERISGKYSKDKNYNASYELRKLIKFGKSIKDDVACGYELFDTAYSYNNCEIMGDKLKLSNNRKRYFIISKCSNACQREDKVIQEFEETLKALGTNYVDLYLIHWPQTGCYLHTWRILEKLYLEGKVRAIGVSNFNIHHIEAIIKNCKVKPMVNEVECHPMLQQKELREYCKKNGIQLIAHTPTGKMRSNIVKSVLGDIAEKNNKTITQVILRWHYQLGDVCIPNTLNKEHASENLDIFDFNLSDEDMMKIFELDCNGRIWPDPDNCNFEEL